MTGRVFVTGSSGFLGRHVRAALEQARIKARYLVRRAAVGHRKTSCATGDLLKLGDAELTAALHGCDSVLHLAGRVSRDRRHTGQMMRLHYEGTRRLLVAAKAARVKRVVVVTTSGTIAVSREPELLDESAPYATELVDRFPYYLSKIAQERLTFSLGAELGLEVVTLNPSLLLGPGDSEGSSNGDLKVLARGLVPLAPSGGLAFVDVRDAAAAVVSSLRHARPGERYLISNHNWTLRDFFDRAASVIGRRGPLVTVPAAIEGGLGRALLTGCRLLGVESPLDPVSLAMGRLFWYCNTDKARRELGLTARDPLETLTLSMQHVLTEVEPASRRAPRRAVTTSDWKWV